jgi:DedD protein
MARAISDEELQLKRRARRRLIGAVVLVTAIIVILPMVLDSEPKTPGQEVSVRIPSPDSAAFTSKVAPTPAAPESKAVPKAPETKPVAKPPVEEAKKIAAAPPVVVAPPAVKEAPKETPKEAPKPTLKAETELSKTPPAKVAPKPAAKKPKPAAKPAPGKFVVQVIALADAARAKEMQGKIAAAGIKSYTEVVKTAKGDVTRVRAGPFATRQQAEKAREQLKALGMSGNIATK